MLIGTHVSQAGGLDKAIARGVERGCQSIQIFNQSPRMWRPTRYTADDFAAFNAAKDDSPIDAVLIHAVYLINCASEDPEIRSKSLASLKQSLHVGDGIGADVVLHPGSALRGDVGEAIARAGEVFAEALAESDRSLLLLEDTAGTGGTLGRSFEELRDLIGAAGGGERLGVCLDSCHLLASGYDVRTADGLTETLDSFDEIVGLGVSARSISTTRRRRWAPTATATPTSARASSARRAAWRSCRSRASSRWRSCWRRPARTARARAPRRWPTRSDCAEEGSRRADSAPRSGRRARARRLGGRLRQAAAVSFSRMAGPSRCCSSACSAALRATL